MTGKKETTLDPAVTATLHRLGVATQEDIQRLTKRIEELDAKIERLMPKAAGGAGSAVSISGAASASIGAPAPREYCFPGMTRIEMADGRAQPISNVASGDLVRCWDSLRSSLAVGRVKIVITGTVDRLIRVNRRLAASPAHRILTQRGYVRFDEVRLGDQLYHSSDMNREPVLHAEDLDGSFPVFNLVVERLACFFAEGLLVEDQLGEEIQEFPYGPGRVPRGAAGAWAEA